MTINQYHFALSEIDNYTDSDLYAFNLSRSSIFSSSSDLDYTYAELRVLWHTYHMTIRDLRTTAGFSRAEFSRRFHIPLRTLDKWESTSPSAQETRKCLVYVRLLIAEALGIMPIIT